jgi:CRISPR-associated protein Cmx8
MGDTLELDYDLAELPSSQHRAGLAGLVLMVRWLDRLKKTDPALNGTCRLTRLDEHGATLLLDRTGLRELFDEVYAASKEEQARDALLKNKQKEIIPPIREEQRSVTDPKTGKSKEKTVYIYPVVVPRGAFLVAYDPTAQGDNGLWIKLWRDMLWGILRGVPATRGPFEERSEGRFTKDADKAWQDLQRPADYTVDLPSTYFIGAQASNAENVPFKDRARSQFLLHFWPFVAAVYIPARLTYDGKTKQVKTEFAGYALTVPDIANLIDFCDELPSVLQNNRGAEAAGYRPRESVIDLAAEGALDLMNKLNQRLSVTVGKQSVSDLLLGVDVVHLEKQGNNIRLWGAARVDPVQGMIDEYARVKGMFRHPLFRRQRLLNVLNNERDWFVGFGRLLSTTDAEQTIGSRFFRADAWAAFKDSLQSKHRTKGEQDEVDTEAAKQDGSPSPVADLIYQLVGTYISAKLDSKYGLKWKNVQGTPGEREYGELKTKVAKEAFLAVRSRTGDDFIEYFASTLCSFPQFLSEDGYATLAQALHTDTDKVRTLTLLALSARG